MYKFNGKKMMTRGINAEIPFSLQMIMWSLIGKLDKKDYLQVFNLSSKDGKQKIVHSQELWRKDVDEPEMYKKEYTFPLSVFSDLDEPLNEKVYVIDDGEYCTMLLASEY